MSTETERRLDSTITQREGGYAATLQSVIGALSILGPREDVCPKSRVYITTTDGRVCSSGGFGTMRTHGRYGPYGRVFIHAEEEVSLEDTKTPRTIRNGEHFWLWDSSTWIIGRARCNEPVPETSPELWFFVEGNEIEQPASDFIVGFRIPTPPPPEPPPQ